MTVQKKRIALFHRYGPGGYMECGGHFLNAAIKRWNELQYEVHFYGYKSSKARAAPSDALKLHLLPIMFRRSSRFDKLIKTFLWYLVLPFMCIDARIKGIRIVFADETLPLTSWFYVLFFGRGASMTVADFFLRIYAEKHPWMDKLDKMVTYIDAWGWKCMGAVFTKTNTAKNYLIQLGVQKNRIHTIYNSCDQERFHPVNQKQARKKLGIQDRAFVLVHHGVLHPNKGNDRIINTVLALTREIPSFLFLLIGNGPEKEALERLVCELGIQSHVMFTGWLPSEYDLNEALNAADVGLVMRIGQTSDHFHITDTLTHEMAAGLPVVAAKLDGIAEIISDGGNGFMFSPEDMRMFTQKVVMLYHDKELREDFSKKSLLIANELFAVESVTAAIVEAVVAMPEL